MREKIIDGYRYVECRTCKDFKIAHAFPPSFLKRQNPQCTNCKSKYDAAKKISSPPPERPFNAMPVEKYLRSD